MVVEGTGSCVSKLRLLGAARPTAKDLGPACCHAVVGFNSDLTEKEHIELVDNSKDLIAQNEKAASTGSNPAWKIKNVSMRYSDPQLDDTAHPSNWKPDTEKKQSKLIKEAKAAVGKVLEKNVERLSIWACLPAPWLPTM